MESVVKQPVAQNPQSGESGGQCRYGLNPCVRQIIDIRGVTVGAEIIKWDLLKRLAGWSYLGGFITAAYVPFVSGIYNTLDSSSFFSLRLHMR